MSCLRNSAQRPSASGQNGCWLHATDTKHVHHIKASPSILFMIRLTETARDYGTGRLLCQRASICKHGKGTCGMVGGSKQMVGPNGFEPSTSSRCHLSELFQQPDHRQRVLPAVVQQSLS